MRSFRETNGKILEWCMAEMQPERNKLANTMKYYDGNVVEKNVLCNSKTDVNITKNTSAEEVFKYNTIIEHNFKARANCYTPVGRAFNMKIVE